MNLLVTGGCGFIGSNFIKYVINKKQICNLVNVDCLSYAGSLDNTKSFHKHPKYLLEKYDLSDYGKTYDTFYKFDITHVVHFAAESHVDNSIKGSKEFVDSNIIGTHALLEAAKKFGVRFHHVSTDEVYGVAKTGERFSEATPYDPKNPYSATKASADMLVLVWSRTYKIPYLILRPTNNYGVGQYIEKLVPKACKYINLERKIPLHNNGLPVRNWLHADDTASAVIQIIESGVVNEIYNVSGGFEQRNIDTVTKILKVFGKDVSNLEEYVDLSISRPGQDVRYSLDDSKLRSLGWYPKKNFDLEIQNIIDYYRDKFIW